MFYVDKKSQLQAYLTSRLGSPSRGELYSTFGLQREGGLSLGPTTDGWFYVLDSEYSQMEGTRVLSLWKSEGEARDHFHRLSKELLTRAKRESTLLQTS